MRVFEFEENYNNELVQYLKMCVIGPMRPPTRLASAAPAHLASLEPSAWRPAATAHRDRMLELVHGSLAANGELQQHDPSHPIFNFIFDYYSFDRKMLLRWSPGPHALVRRARQGRGSAREPLIWQGRGWRQTAEGGWYDACETTQPSARRSMRQTAEILRRSAGRAPHLNCYGMHEWAMLYEPAGAPAMVRHQKLPLRLAQGELNGVVESTPLACTHFDAFRFFAPAAAPLNEPQPTLARQAELEQPGCVHSTMDLFRHALRLFPYLPAELLADTLELAVAARVLDMRASPYDLSGVDAPGFDLRAVRVETAHGRKEYQRMQAAVARRAAPLRLRLLRYYDDAIARWDEAEEHELEQCEPTVATSSSSSSAAGAHGAVPVAAGA